MNQDIISDIQTLAPQKGYTRCGMFSVFQLTFQLLVKRF